MIIDIRGFNHGDNKQPYDDLLGYNTRTTMVFDADSISYCSMERTSQRNNLQELETYL